LVKRYHPDTNGGGAEAEDKIKMINQAFTVLKQIYGESVP
jgi:curved DNA-binding protein CbpA